MEIWGGHECTVNRVGDCFRDQTLLTGHQDRVEDLSRFAELGITKLRYPVLWERVAPARPDEHDWRWSDERLNEISRLGMQPIVGLLHHGSGPRYTSLIADNFVQSFAGYAAAVAERYPWVTHWTPINEPLTTARFSALYGVWYPHTRDERLFWTALLNQIEGICAAMKAIRRVNPDARLIQTEDLGKYHSAPPLAASVEHLNHRCWMTWDLLAGKVTDEHPLWSHVAAFGLGNRLRRIADAARPPDIIGVNYYPTSERFLDHRLDLHPSPPPTEGYHDLSAARVMNPPSSGLAGLMREAWERYRLPVAVTESHLGCTREEQLRWLWQSWDTCSALAADGIDVVALTAWALLGNMDWNSLITVAAGHYETGAFDVSSGQPRATAVASLLASLSSGTPPSGTVAAVAHDPGWWQRDIRLEYPPVACVTAIEPAIAQDVTRQIVITGATGTLGQALARECTLRGLSYLLTDRATLPIDDPGRVRKFLLRHRPWAVINAAGWVRVDDAEADPAGCMRANSDGAAILAEACDDLDISCTIFSSDLVFDGTRLTPYLEDDAPNPLGIYGRSKAEAEALLRRFPRLLVIRTAAFFSPDDPHNFAAAVESALRDERTFAASADHMVSPAFVPDLVRACLDLVIDGETGIWHLANEGAVSWFDFAQMLAKALGLDPGFLETADAHRLGWTAARPRYAALSSRRGRLMPDLEDAVARYAAARDRARERPHVAQHLQSRASLA